MADASAFQPLFPEERTLGPLHDLSAQVIDGCLRLGGHGVARSRGHCARNCAR